MIGFQPIRYQPHLRYQFGGWTGPLNEFQSIENVFIDGKKTVYPTKDCCEYSL